MVKKLWCLSALFLLVPLSVIAKKADVKLVSINIRNDMKQDSINRWVNRRVLFFQFIKEQEPDIFCLQEAVYKQLNDIRKNSDLYACVKDSKSRKYGSLNPIFYLKEKYTCLGKGVFALSESPDSIGVVGWDALLPRTATWVKLKDEKCGKVFFVFNTHLDVKGKVAREKGMELIKNYIDSISGDYPVILTGDMNSTKNSPAYKIATTKRRAMLDSYDIAAKKRGVSYTAHNFGKSRIEKRNKIDFIFVSDNVKVKKVDIPQEEPVLGVYLTDHNPVIVDINF